MDIKSEEERSCNMAKIRSKDTKPEMFIRSIFHKQNYRFRINYNKVEGSPDLYFTKKKIAVFVHGCYWHRHKECKYAYTPKTNIEFWNKKFTANIERDRVVMNTLMSMGIRVIIIWECTVRNMRSDVGLLQRNFELINEFMRSDSKPYINI